MSKKPKTKRDDTVEKVIGFLLGAVGGLALASALEHKYGKKRYRLIEYRDAPLSLITAVLLSGIMMGIIFTLVFLIIVGVL
jgi:hypothetical protein